MKKIIILGAGLSSSALIHYLESKAQAAQWALTIADLDTTNIKGKVASERTEILAADLSDDQQLSELIRGRDLVVSMLPASMHLKVAEICLEQHVNLATASYRSKALKDLDQRVREKDLIFLNECGLDPGIDHLSAMQLLDGIRAKGGKITAFESFTGGLVAPDCEDNPWRYKFTWNPRNVVVAAQGGAVKFIQNGKYKYIPYHKVFRRTEIVEIEGYGKFEGYANRDSLTYREAYGLQDVQTMFRGTFRRPGFSRAWDCLVQLGATDDSYKIEDSEHMTHRDFINTFLAYHPTDSVELKLKMYLHIAQDDTELWERLVSLNLFSDDKIGIPNASPAQILQHILMKVWHLKPGDRDMIVMSHKINYLLDGETYRLESSLVTEGESEGFTAMAKTVGLPLAIACELILTNKIDQRGSVLPLKAEFYEPILEALRSFGIVFNEKHFKEA